MPLRDLLKKKDKLDKADPPPNSTPQLEQPVFLFMRSDTNTQEIISPPSFYEPKLHPALPTIPLNSTLQATDGSHESRTSRLFKSSRSRSHSSASAISTTSINSEKSKGGSPKSKRLSQRLHLKRPDPTSAAVPEDLPEITTSVADLREGADETGVESQWEKRATILARKNEASRSRPQTPLASQVDVSTLTLGEREGKGVVATKNTDDNIQEAIRLHEAGELQTSTRMFGRLADPEGENNALSQVLYGMALRHGWGCDPDPTKAVKYLTLAASNAAGIEDLALKAGMTKGGAAKGELVLAIFELANCFRHGWGVNVDKFAAQRYYETAANLGDTDAMNEVAWCYVEGFGCKKDKFAAAKYYRLAEEGGNKTLGNSWIWKDKYNPPAANGGASSSKKKK